MTDLRYASMRVTFPNCPGCGCPITAFSFKVYSLSPSNSIQIDHAHRAWASFHLVPASIVRDRRPAGTVRGIVRDIQQKVRQHLFHERKIDPDEENVGRGINIEPVAGELGGSP